MKHFRIENTGLCYNIVVVKTNMVITNRPTRKLAEQAAEEFENTFFNY